MLPYHALCLQFNRPTNLSLHDYLEFRVRSCDDHTYIASVRCDQYTGGDEEAWQAPLALDRCVTPAHATM